MAEESFAAARKLFMRAEYDEREGRVEAAALALRLADLAPVTRAVNALLRLDALQPGARVLDLGTGAGTFALAAARASPRADVLGLDLSPGAVAAAARAADALGVANARFAVADFEMDPLPAADGVVLAYALSLAEDAGRALANARAALRDGARLVVFDAHWRGNGLTTERLDALARGAGLALAERRDLTPGVRALVAAGRWPWAGAPADEARFVASAYGAAAGRG